MRRPFRARVGFSRTVERVAQEHQSPNRATVGQPARGRQARHPPAERMAAEDRVPALADRREECGHRLLGPAAREIDGARREPVALEPLTHAPMLAAEPAAPCPRMICHSMREGYGLAAASSSVAMPRRRQVDRAQRPRPATLGYVALLALKLVLTPLLIGVASLGARRWGPTAGGWIVALPLTSGPVALFLALDRGPTFAAAAAHASLAGCLAIAAYCLAYSRLADRGWRSALTVATGAWLVGALAAEATAAWLVPATLVIAVTATAAALVLLPAREARRAATRSGRAIS